MANLISISPKNMVTWNFQYILVILCINSTALFAETNDTAAYDSEMQAIYVRGGPNVESNSFFTWLKYAEKGLSDAQYKLGLSLMCDNSYSQSYTAAHYWLQRAFDQGNKRAAYHLGNLYEYGDGVTQDYAQAFHYYSSAQDMPEAQRDLAWYYRTGTVVSQDQKKAYAYLASAADKGDVLARYDLAEYYERTNNLERAFSLYHAAAEEEYSPAMDRLYNCYLTGTGTPQNFTNALYWLRRYHETDNSIKSDLYKELFGGSDTIALYSVKIQSIYAAGGPYVKSNVFFTMLTYAKAGLDEAQVELGWSLACDNTYSQNYTAAHYWLQRAFDQGNKKAAYYLGYLYEYGDGVVQDYAKAFMYYSIADERLNAQIHLSWFYRTGTIVSQDQKKAYAYLASAADKGDEIAQYFLAEYYERTNNPERAFSLYHAAAEQEYSPAMDRLWSWYAIGKGTSQDFSRAAYWLSQYLASKSNTATWFYTDLQESPTNGCLEYITGDIYIKGYGLDIAKNHTNAFKYYHAAAEKGYGRAQMQTALMYMNGDCVTQDFSLSFAWFQKAASNDITEAFYRLGNMYRYGIGTGKDKSKAYQAYKRYVDSDDTDRQMLSDAYYQAGIISIKQGRIISGLRLLGNSGKDIISEKYVGFSQSGYGIAIAFVLFGIVCYSLFGPGRHASWGILDAVSAICLVSYIPLVIMNNSYRFGCGEKWFILEMFLPLILLSAFVILAIKKHKWKAAESFSIKPVALKRLIKWVISGFVICLAADMIYFTPLYYSNIDTGGSDFIDAIIIGVKNINSHFIGYIILLIIICILAVFEEILFRGILYKGLRSKLPVYVSVGITSLLFALIHFEVIRIIPLFINSIVFCLAFEKTQSIIPPVLIHAGINVFAVSILFFLV